MSTPGGRSRRLLKVLGEFALPECGLVRLDFRERGLVAPRPFPVPAVQFAPPFFSLLPDSSMESRPAPVVSVFGPVRAVWGGSVLRVRDTRISLSTRWSRNSGAEPQAGRPKP